MRRGPGVGDYTPQRIICLTEETTETLYLLGEEERIVGISGYTVRPPEARRDKPRISAFTSARIDKILELEPDLVLAYSDLQADIVRQLIAAGIAVHAFNQRQISGIFTMILTLGALVGAADKARALIMTYETRLQEAQDRAKALPRHPRIYFEEWPDPLITGIGWVSELITLAGGEECFPELAGKSLAKDRIIPDPSEVITRAPDIIIASWCGRKFQPDPMRQRKGWSAIPAVRDGELHEIKSPLILQPGPAALSEGLSAIETIIQTWALERS